MVSKGEQAPNFILQDQHGIPLQLDELKGSRVVIYFYPRDNTPGCTTEAQEFSALNEEFKSLNTVIIGISKNTTASHYSFCKKAGLRITLLSDPDLAISKQYGAWGEKMLYGKKSQGVIRSTVLVDSDGVIRAYWNRVKAAGHAREVLATLRSLVQ